MVIALMIYRVGRHRDLQFFKVLGLVLIACSVLMSVSRVAVGVHRPTDILAGWGVAIIVVYLVTLTPIRKRQKHYIIKPLITLQERLFGMIGIKS